MDIYNILEILSVTFTSIGVMLTTSKRARNRMRGFIILSFSGVCSIAVFNHEALYIMLGQSVFFMFLNARGIKNNLDRGN